MAFINFGMANTLAQAKASTNKNKLFFPTDSKKIVIDGKEYGGIDGVDIESKNSMYGVVGNGNNITDGVAAIKGIKGNTIAWNQLVKNGNFTVNAYWENLLSVENGVGTSKSLQRYQAMHQNINFIDTHKYYVAASVKSSVDNSLVTLQIQSDYTHYDYVDINTNTSSFQRGSSILTAKTGYTSFRLTLWSGAMTMYVKNVVCIDLTLIYGAGNEPTSVAQFEADYQRWFGKPLTYEPYDAGSLRNVMMSAIKTTGFNQCDEIFENGSINVENGEKIPTPDTPTLRTKNFQRVLPNTEYYFPSFGAYVRIAFYDANKVFISGVRMTRGVVTTPSNAAYTMYSPEIYGTTYNHNICINISDPSRNRTYEPYRENIASLPITTLTGKLNGQGESVIIFPDGMKSVGNIHDEIFVDNGVVKAIKRLGKIDMGAISYIYKTTIDNTNVFVSRDTIQNLKKSSALCARYVNSHYFNDKNKVFNVERGGSSTSNVYLKDDSFEYSASGCTALQAYLNGVELIYQLAEPQVYVLDDDVLPLMYKVDELGTEQVLPECTEETPCCAPELDIRYRITPVEVLDNFSKVTNNKQVKAVADNARIEDRIVTWGSDGATIKDGGYKITDLLPTILTLEWNDNENAIVIDSVSNYKQVPNSVVCKYWNLVMQMSFCDDATAAKLIGTFVATTEFINAFEAVSGITLIEDTMYLLQINVNWEPVSIEGTDTISIRTMDGTYVYPSGDDSSSSGSGSEPYDDWQINGNTPDGTSILDLYNFNYVGGEAVSMITCCPEGSDNPIFVTGSSTGEYTKDVTWDSTNNYWKVEGGLSTEGTYVLKAYNASHNVVSEIQIVIV